MFQNDIEVLVEICREDVILPSYANDGDAGMDVYAAKATMIKGGDTVVVPTGIKLAIPEGYEIQVRPRSGISLKTPLRLSNSPGTIDSGYRNELGIIITNTSILVQDESRVFTLDDSENNKGSYLIRKGDKIAQLVLQTVPKIKFKVVDSVNGFGKNRGGGFGSTGVR